ncbi:MAG: photosynthetic protein synthase I [Chloroflexi bacterium]|mgnify:CR=1 FL=1|nr:photosynthetic protein synthase I [Chloroflexota bacterium]MBT4074241.1 photosynthetic protein synthase I [Chloroflexota bacterium]MBT4516097.1 photosynthetic protein synthase I [Chloroflexota bacterium]MBT6682953.1 photosynthetic protein synthase I [Chloroflexota bacterium]
MSPRRTGVILLLVVLVAALSVPVALASLSGEPQPDSQPSGQNQVTAASIATQADLGRLLFFDPRLSGNGVTSCSSCHLPEKAWTDGEALSSGYTSVEYFRNTPTLLNASQMALLDWDGRFDGSDMATVVRDHIAEAHFMHMDGRLLVERMLQTPVYAEAFERLFGNEASYGKVLNSLAAFVATLESTDNPYLAFKAGDDMALNVQQRAGLQLFEGKAGCSSCHSDVLLADGDLHVTGVPANPEIFSNTDRHITFRRFFKQFGVGEFAELRSDPGRFAMTHDEADRGRFRTPSLLEIARTAPYMHNGVIASLEDVVAFYNEGGGDVPNKDPLLKPLNLNADEVDSLVAFLGSLGSDDTPFDIPAVLPPYELRTLGAN